MAPAIKKPHAADFRHTAICVNHAKMIQTTNANPPQFIVFSSERYVVVFNASLLRSWRGLLSGTCTLIAT
jgi:hypothetical protein